MPASKFQPVGSDSGAPQKFSGGSKDVQKVDKGKRRRTDSEERRAADEEEEERLQANIEAADSALADQIRRRIQRNGRSCFGGRLLCTAVGHGYLR